MKKLLIIIALGAVAVFTAYTFGYIKMPSKSDQSLIGIVGRFDEVTVVKGYTHPFHKDIIISIDLNENEAYERNIRGLRAVDSTLRSYGYVSGVVFSRDSAIPLSTEHTKWGLRGELADRVNIGHWSGLGVPISLDDNRRGLIMERLLLVQGKDP
jgi:hypothetical protein